ncbi:hypothetical protein [Demequina zhanjiangensis]|uniref:Heavy metal transporter n=1 Tax=Demequina zhanjiangensis TaxID=3051659 RepID=A0ABT8G0Y5_9MICO|nr:hypothetical protein [Demequina sp. SYSU T00b26]MDN4472801.1 hypothetical protein [Demequina sp. SYSU T00b26]
MARRPRRRGARFVAFLVFAAVAAAGIVWGPQWWDRHSDRFSTQRCTVTVGGESHSLTAEQADNAAIIAARSAWLDLRARAATIALATAIQESGLRNIDYGDRDSLGLFQQRPSQGWGSEAEIMNVRYSATAFYTALMRVDGWEDMEITVAAQTVQRSAFPLAYADHEPEARLWATALRGYGGPDALTCDIAMPEASTASAFVERLEADFGADLYDAAVTGTGAHTSVTLTPVDGTDVTRDQVAAWSVASASTTGVTAVITATSTWTVEDGMSSAGDETLGQGVRVEIRTEGDPQEQ